MKIRKHCGLLSESMSIAKDIEPTKQAICDYLNGFPLFDVKPDSIEVKPYGFDGRIQWDTYIVLESGMAVAFSDSPVSE